MTGQPTARGLRLQRLAMSFIVHHHRKDVIGMNGVLDDLTHPDGEDPTRFALALANVADYLLTEGCGDQVEDVLGRAITALAQIEGDTPDV